ncbi:PREDICTED: male-enhanced antigen 1 [Polistes canadensis]|uniref:male-enhanced antigen 1 n=1 Tax=Polistes canadensis TaxID=91411 RepID=UPI000718DA73|nr:PREDICTED: male-enhanced antigen 1 [Polistes canadensis]
MSPEPTEEPIKESLNVPNLTVDTRMTTDSESEDEDVGMTGYMPLSQLPTDSDLILEDDEDDEWISQTGEINHAIPVSLNDSQQLCFSETIEVWSSPSNRSNIDMDTDKINQVKSMMASFTLPSTAIPEWANTISEEEWKEQLIDRIKEMQNKEKSD